MDRFKIVYVLLVAVAVATEAEDSKPPDEAAWDSLPSEGRHWGPRYLPPTQQRDSFCHPCNAIPWVPIASNHHSPPPPSHQTYGPPSHHKAKQLHHRPDHIKYLRPPPAPSSHYTPSSDHPPRSHQETSSHYTPSFHHPPGPHQAPSSHHKPIKVEILLGMKPPPISKATSYSHYLAEASELKDSYGAPVTDWKLPPIEQLPLATDPIPFPNMHQGPVLPLHAAQDFYDEFKSSQNVELQPSVQIAEFLSSVEHPINVVQSPLVEININQPDLESHVKPTGFYHEKLSENPIIVDDTHTAGSTINETVNRLESYNFTPPSQDYGSWAPKGWGKTTPKPKQIQIIVPYVSKKPTYLEKKPVGKSSYSTLLPMIVPPSFEDDVWSRFAEELLKVKKSPGSSFTPPSSTQVYNIQDLLRDSKEYPTSEKLPFDVISLQHNIDDWTQKEFGNTKSQDKTTSKQIPQKYFIEHPTTPVFDHEQAASNKKEVNINKDIESNFILEEPESTTSGWELVKSTPTNEKLYVVTPQNVEKVTLPTIAAWSLPPKIQNGKNVTFLPNAKFLIRVDPDDGDHQKEIKDSKEPVTIVLSEWPHLINNLQTTTSQKPPTSKHPLLGLMDLFAYTPPPNSTVETISGHSKVATVVTPETRKNIN